jgi:hypothetical protein
VANLALRLDFVDVEQVSLLLVLEHDLVADATLDLVILKSFHF